MTDFSFRGVTDSSPARPLVLDAAAAAPAPAGAPTATATAVGAEAVPVTLAASTLAPLTVAEVLARRCTPQPSPHRPADACLCQGRLRKGTF